MAILAKIATIWTYAACGRNQTNACFFIALTLRSPPSMSIEDISFNSLKLVALVCNKSPHKSCLQRKRAWTHGNRILFAFPINKRRNTGKRSALISTQYINQRPNADQKDYLINIRNSGLIMPLNLPGFLNRRNKTIERT